MQQIWATQLNQSQELSLPSHRYPFTPGWREVMIVKCLAQGPGLTFIMFIVFLVSYKIGFN